MASPQQPARRLERLERSRAALLARLDEAGPERLHRCPGPGRWSASQVLCHVLRTEELALDYVRKKLQDPSGLSDAGLASAARSLVLKLALRSPLKFRAPPRVADVPDAEPLAETRRRWDAIRAGWAQVVETFPAELLEKEVFRHVKVGRLTLAQTLAFMDEHFEHHRKQAEALAAPPAVKTGAASSASPSGD